MPLIVVPQADADALIDRAYFTEFAEKMGWDLTGKDPDKVIDPAIRRASLYMSLGWGWSGAKVGPTVLAFPRTMYDAAGVPIPTDPLPEAIRMATAYATWEEVQRPNSLMPTVRPEAPVKRKKVGSLEVEYFNAPAIVQPIITALAPLLAGFLLVEEAADNPLVGFSYRV